MKIESIDIYGRVNMKVAQSMSIKLLRSFV